MYCDIMIHNDSKNLQLDPAMVGRQGGAVSRLGNIYSAMLPGASGE